MAHYARIGVGNIVIETHVLNNDVLMKDGVENEQQGVEFLQNLFSNRDLYIQTSYNNSFRKNYAGEGYSYDSTRDAFIPHKPYSSWLLNEDTCNWESPISKPEGDYIWNEGTQAWDAV